ncbi:MAG TPA: hypothetical protein VFZ28_17835 [Burkholderiaceae bacterium]|nr:hypothetical protein [Burkholderiaceae bacterium]
MIAALLAWRLPRRAGAALGAALALARFSFDELKPLQFGDASNPVRWVPFAALLQGSLSANTLSLTWQLFWQGTVIVMLHAIGARVGVLAFALSVWTLLLELLQVWLPGRTPDITPALLPWFWVGILPLLQVLSEGEGTKSVARFQMIPPRHAP